MAIQNFIGGGFKGKLGATIGQGWKNKKVIRSGFVPSNPRTKKQQSNRSDFSKCVKMAQFAMQMDFRSVGFQSDDNTEWALRIGSARRYFDKSLPEMYCIPLLPYGTVAGYAVSDVFEVSSGVLTLHCDTIADISARSFAVLLYLKKTDEEVYDYHVLQSQWSGTAGDWSISFSLPTGYEVADDSLCCGVSNDDTVLTTKIYRSPFSIARPLETITFTLSAPQVSGFAVGDQNFMMEVTPSVALPDMYIVDKYATVRGVLQGEWEESTDSGSLDVRDGKVYIYEFDAMDALGQRLVFPTGSSITIPAFSFVSDYKRYVFEGATISFSETVSAQTLTIESTAMQYVSDIGFMATIKSDMPNIAEQMLNMQVINSLNPSTGVNENVGHQMSILSEDSKCNLYLYGDIYKGSNVTIAGADIGTITLNGVVYNFNGQNLVVETLKRIDINLGDYEWATYDYDDGDGILVTHIGFGLTDNLLLNSVRPARGFKIVNGTKYYCSSTVNGWRSGQLIGYSLVGFEDTSPITDSTTLGVEWDSQETGVASYQADSGVVVYVTTPASNRLSATGLV